MVTVTVNVLVLFLKLLVGITNYIFLDESLFELFI